MKHINRFNFILLASFLFLCSAQVQGQFGNLLIYSCTGNDCNSTSDYSHCGGVWSCNFYVCVNQDLSILGLIDGNTPTSLYWGIDGGSMQSLSNPRTYSWSTPGVHTIEIGIIPLGTFSGTIYVLPQQPSVPAISYSGPVCEGDDVCISCDLFDGAVAESCVDWGDGTPEVCQSGDICANGTLCHTYASSGSYPVTITNIGCTGVEETTTINVVVLNVDDVVIAGPSNTCGGSVLTFTVPTGLNTYDWGVNPSYISSGDGSNTFQVSWGSTSGTVYFQGTNSDGCPVSASHSVVMNTVQSSISASNGCVGELICFSNNTTYTGATPTYSWNFGANAIPSTSTDPQPCVVFTSAGIQTVTLAPFNGCPSSVASTTTNILPLPNIGLPPPFEGCFGNQISIIPLISSVTTCTWTVTNANGSYSYSGSSLNFTATVPGLHTISITCNNAFGCTATESTTVTIQPCAGPDSLTCQRFSGGLGGTAWLEWTDLDATEYEIEVTTYDATCCSTQGGISETFVFTSTNDFYSLSNAGNYHCASWRVRALVDGYWTLWSDSKCLCIDGVCDLLPLSAPYCKYQNGIIGLSWTEQAGYINYQIQVENGSCQGCQSSNSNSYQYTSSGSPFVLPLSAAAYPCARWRVRGQCSDGTWSAWTSYLCLCNDKKGCKLNAPGKPDCQVSKTTNLATLSWSPVAGATGGYQIIVTTNSCNSCTSQGSSVSYQFVTSNTQYTLPQTVSNYPCATWIVRARCSQYTWSPWLGPMCLCGNKKTATNEWSEVAHMAFPNPSDGHVTFMLAIDTEMMHNFELVSLSGTIVRSLILDKGVSRLDMDLTELSGGIYFYRTVSDHRVSDYKKLILE